MRSTWPSHWCCTFFTIASVWLRAVLMSSFLISSMMRTPSIFLSAAISNTSSCFSSALLSVHASQPYKAICTISFWSRSWCFWFFQMLFKSLITSKAVAVLILMSVEQSQLFLESFHMLQFLPPKQQSFLYSIVHCLFRFCTPHHPLLESLISCPYFELTLSTLFKKTWACLSTCVKRPKSSAKRKL